MRSHVLFGSKRARALLVLCAWLISGCCASGSSDAPSAQADAGPAPSSSAPPPPPPSAAAQSDDNRPGPEAAIDRPAGPLVPRTGEGEREIAGAAHILIAFKGAEGAPKTITRSKEDAKKRATEALEKLRKDTSKFEEIVKKYSDDETSKPAEGRLGNSERNAMPKAFSDATFAMKVDTISDVVESPRGFHIIKRTK
jgi:hypothetical protein